MKMLHALIATLASLLLVAYGCRQPAQDTGTVSLGALKPATHGRIKTSQ